MKIKFLLLSIFCCFFAYSQVKEETRIHIEDPKPFYMKFDFSIPLKVNQYAGEINPYTDEEETWFLPDGLSARAGIGSHFDKWIGGGINIGLDWKASKCLVILPVFASFRISPRIAEDFRITSEIGYGRAFSISGDHLSGNFKKISLGIEDEESGLGLYMELCQYGFAKNSPERCSNLVSNQATGVVACKPASH